MRNGLRLIREPSRSFRTAYYYPRAVTVPVNAVHASFIHHIDYRFPLKLCHSTTHIIRLNLNISIALNW